MLSFQRKPESSRCSLTKFLQFPTCFNHNSASWRRPRTFLQNTIEFCNSLKIPKAHRFGLISHKRFVLSFLSEVLDSQPKADEGRMPTIACLVTKKVFMISNKMSSYLIRALNTSFAKPPQSVRLLYQTTGFADKHLQWFVNWNRSGHFPKIRISKYHKGEKIPQI